MEVQAANPNDDDKQTLTEYIASLSADERGLITADDLSLDIAELLLVDGDEFDNLINKSRPDLDQQQQSRRIEIIKRIRYLQIWARVQEEGSKHQWYNGNGNGNDNGNSEDPSPSDGQDEPVTIEEATEYILSQHSYTTLKENDLIYVYKDGLYIADGEIVMKQELEKRFGYDLNRNRRAEIREHIRNKTYKSIEDFDSELDIINLKNGLYNIKTGKLTPHNPDYLSSKQQPIIYNPFAPVPRKFIKFLKEVVYPGDLWTLIELMAYTFLRDNPFEIIIVLLGNGSNGKSVVFGILAGLHGPKNVSNVSLKTMVERPFGLYDLVGKDCNLDAEMSSGIIRDTAILKKITGRQLIRVEQKNQKAFHARIYAKEWLNCNALPQINPDDQNDAYYRRNIIVGFPNKFEEMDYRLNCEGCRWQEAEDKSQNIFKLDPDLINKLTTPEELSGIFNLLMYALRRILSEKRISVSDKTIEERKQKYELAVNPVAVFLKLAVKPDSEVNDTASKELVYLAYKKFCKFYKLCVMGKTMFGKALKRLNVQEGRVRDENDKSKVVRVWMGINLTQDYLTAISLEQDTLDAFSRWGV